MYCELCSAAELAASQSAPFPLLQPKQTSIGEVAALAQEARGNITGEPLQLLLTPPRAPAACTPPRLPEGETLRLSQGCRR